MSIWDKVLAILCEQYAVPLLSEFAWGTPPKQLAEAERWMESLSESDLKDFVTGQWTAEMEQTINSDPAANAAAVIVGSTIIPPIEEFAATGALKGKRILH